MKDLFEKICQTLTEKFGAESVEAETDDQFIINLDENSYIEIATHVDEFQDTAFYMYYTYACFENIRMRSNPIQTFEEFECEYSQINQHLEQFTYNLNKSLQKL